MPNDLTPARLRELIASGYDAKSICPRCAQGEDDAHQALIDYLHGHAPALADALEKAKLLEWALRECQIWAPIERDENGLVVDCMEVDTVYLLKQAKEKFAPPKEADDAK